MKSLVTSFEKEARSLEFKEEYNLYESIKDTLSREYDYVDLESVFSVLEQLSRNIEFKNLGFTSMYELSKLGRSGKEKISDSKTQNMASRLIDKFTQFIKEECDVNKKSNDVDKEIKRVFFNLYDTIGSSLSSRTEQPIEGGKLHRQNWPIYTTNYDLVQERFWEGIEENNDLSER